MRSGLTELNNFNGNMLPLKKAEKWLKFLRLTKFRPAKIFKSFDFYCYYWRVTKISTDYVGSNFLYTNPLSFIAPSQEFWKWLKMI